MDEPYDPEEDETVTAVRGRGPLPLPLEGWDHASIWGWDKTIGSLYAHLRRNTDDQTPAVQIRPGEYTPVINCAATLAQHIAMHAECSPWTVLMALDDASGLNDDDNPPASADGGTVVTVAEGYSLPGWPYRQQR